MEEEKKEVITVQAEQTNMEVSPVRIMKGVEDSYKMVRNILDMMRRQEAKITELEAYIHQVPAYPERSETIGQLITALAKAKLAANKYIRSGRGHVGSYGSLDDMRLAFEEPLAENGLIITFALQERNGMWVLVSRLVHQSEEFIECISTPTPKSTIKDPDQALAGSLTSHKRYGYAMLLGINS